MKHGYIRAVICRIVAGVASLVLAAAPARGDGLVVVGGTPRAIGRAGTGTVGDDGGGALLLDPAMLARRDTHRVQLGIAVTEDTITFTGNSVDAPEARNQAAPPIAPLVAVQAGIGGFVLGLGVMTSGVTERAFRDPNSLPATQLGPRFDYRYAGISGSVRRDTVALGVARRIGDSLAIGASFAASRVALRETRRMWAGFDGREPLYDPGSDMQIALAATDVFVPSATAGVLFAPDESPLELGAAVTWSDSIVADGTFAAAGVPGGPTVELTAPTASIGVRQPLTIRGGVRYLGERLVVEVGGEYNMIDDRATTTRWQVTGARVRDPSDFDVNLPPVPSRISLRSHMAMRGAIDINVFEGFLWITGGYAFSRGGTPLTRLSPSFGNLGGHTLAFGLEGYAGGVTITLGYSRTFSTRHPVPQPDLLTDNPFNAGAGRALGGSYDGSIDQLGLSLDLEL